MADDPPTRISVVSKDERSGWAWRSKRGMWSNALTGDIHAAGLAAVAAATAACLGRNQDGPVEVRVPVAVDITVPQGAHFDALRAAVAQAQTKRAVVLTVGEGTRELDERARRAVRDSPIRPDVWVAVDAGWRYGSARLAWITIGGLFGQRHLHLPSTTEAEFAAAAFAVRDLGGQGHLRVVADHMHLVRSFQMAQQSKSPQKAKRPSLAEFYQVISGRRWDSCWWVPGGAGLHAAAHDLTQPSWAQAMSGDGRFGAQDW